MNDCTLYRMADIVGKKWTMLILFELYKGKNKIKRYSEIKRSMPDITPKMLSSRLKELEKEELISKKIDASAFPIKCEYALTPSGKEFITIIKDMKKWTLKWKVDNKICKQTNCKDCVF